MFIKVRQRSKQNVFRPARTIAEDVILESVQSEDVAIPKKSLLKRVGNRARAKYRPSEPDSLDFEVRLIFYDDLIMSVLILFFYIYDNFK